MNFTQTNQLRKGMVVAVRAGSHGRAISVDQDGGIEWVEVRVAYPAGREGKRRMAGTVVEFTDGAEQVYNTNSVWMVQA